MKKVFDEFFYDGTKSWYNRLYHEKVFLEIFSYLIFLVCKYFCELKDFGITIFCDALQLYVISIPYVIKERKKNKNHIGASVMIWVLVSVLVQKTMAPVLRIT